MTPQETYDRYTTVVNPEDATVQDEIRRGIRMPGGLTDIHYQLERLRNLSEGNVLEIGVRFGVSTAAILCGLDDIERGHLWSVDIDDCSGLFNHPRWTFVQADSVKSSDIIKAIIPNKLDLLFIDGDHEYESVKADLDNFAPLARVVALHDAAATGHPGVLKAIKEYMVKPNTRQSTCCIYEESHGLAVLA